MKTTAYEKLEIEYWKKSDLEKPSNFSTKTIALKLPEAAIFLGGIEKYKNLFIKSNSIFEVGAGQGWASCLLKKSTQGKKYTAQI